MSDEESKINVASGADLSPSIPCCVCRTTAARPWRLAGDNLLGGETLYRAVRCIACGTARLDPRPTLEAMAQFYAPTTYARAEGSEDRELARRLDTYNRRLARRADTAVRSRAIGKKTHARKVLDVGCGDGRFLAAMAVRGWRCEGMETDAVAAELARHRTGATVHETPLESLSGDESSYDLVSLLHVLEHVPDPRVTLEAARRVLKPGGTLLLALPNIRCLEAMLFGNAWYHLDLPRHFWGFTPRTLSRLVTESGFSVTSLRFFPFLFAPQSLRYALRPRCAPVAAALSPTRNGSGKVGSGNVPTRNDRLRTRAFLTLLRFSERLGQIFPGEVMEVTAITAPSEE